MHRSILYYMYTCTYKSNEIVFYWTMTFSCWRVAVMANSLIYPDFHLSPCHNQHNVLYSCSFFAWSNSLLCFFWSFPFPILPHHVITELTQDFCHHLYLPFVNSKSTNTINNYLRIHEFVFIKPFVSVYFMNSVGC